MPIQILQFLFKTCCFQVVHGERDRLKLHAPLDNVHTLHTVLYQTERIILYNNFHRKQNFRHTASTTLTSIMQSLYCYLMKICLLHNFCDICLFYGNENRIQIQRFYSVVICISMTGVCMLLSANGLLCTRHAEVSLEMLPSDKCLTAHSTFEWSLSSVGACMPLKAFLK